MKPVLAFILVAGIALVHADAPSVYAIRGARIVTAAGPPIESGTIVIRGGRIDAVGASVTPPPDAELIDGSHLIVYPGLIDLGNTRAAEQAAPQQPQNLRTTAEVERWKRTQILKPQARAADAVKVDDAELTKLVAAGVTTVLAVPPGDVLSGESALVNVVAPPDEPQIGNIVEARRRLVVVKTPIALHVSFPDRPRAGGNAYPESLMGVIAFVRQSFLDAQNYAALRASQGKPRSNGNGVPPADDPALEAMIPALDRKLPVAFEANEVREILRALKMAREFNLDPIVTGAREAELAAVDLKRQNARLVYSLNYPQKPKNLAPDADEPIAKLRARAEAPKMPAALAREGLPFAFESAGLAEPKDFVRNAGKAVKAGLPAEAAVRALTINAATIAGVGDRLGSIEKGKIANLVVTDGDLFDDNTKVTRVFVEGRPVPVDVPAKTTSTDRR